MSDTQSADTDAVRKNPDQVLVFISYSHDDKDLADCLRDELREIDSDRVLVFQDAYSIRSGERWDLSIIENLKAADWLIFLYTGRERRSYDYCGFEIGIFASAHQLDTSHKISEVARLVCLHDTSEVPPMLRMVQNRYTCSYEPEGSSDFSEAEEFQFYKDSDLARFFEDFYQYPPDKPLRRGVLPRKPGMESRLREQPHLAAEIAGRVKKLATRFRDGRKNDPIAEKFYQVRMEIDIRAPMSRTVTEIPARAIITASQDTFNLIGISPDPDRNQELKITWDQLRTALINNNETFAWMEKVEDDVLDAVHQRNLRSPETTFRAQDGQFYRPLLARQIMYGSGARKFSVMFVRTLPRKFAGDESTSALLVGLILASRFRFNFVEGRRQLLEETFGDKISDTDFQLSCRQLIYDVERMEQESSEFGMNSPELLKEAFGEGNHEIVTEFYQSWFPARAALFDVLKQRIASSDGVTRQHIRQEIQEFSERMKPYNRRFMEMCLAKYSHYLRDWLRRE